MKLSGFLDWRVFYTIWKFQVATCSLSKVTNFCCRVCFPFQLFCIKLSGLVTTVFDRFWECQVGADSETKITNFYWRCICVNTHFHKQRYEILLKNANWMKLGGLLVPSVFVSQSMRLSSQKCHDTVCLIHIVLLYRIAEEPYSKDTLPLFASKQDDLN